MADRILGMMNPIIFSWDWTAPDWTEIIVSAVISLINAILIALITSVVLNRILANDRAVGKSLREYGINASTLIMASFLRKPGIFYSENMTIRPRKKLISASSQVSVSSTTIKRRFKASWKEGLWLRSC